MLFTDAESAGPPGLPDLAHEAAHSLVAEPVKRNPRMTPQREEQRGESIDVAASQPAHRQRVHAMERSGVDRVIHGRPHVSFVRMERIQKRRDRSAGREVQDVLQVDAPMPAVGLVDVEVTVVAPALDGRGVDRQELGHLRRGEVEIGIEPFHESVSSRIVRRRAG